MTTVTMQTSVKDANFHKGHFLEQVSEFPKCPKFTTFNKIYKILKKFF